MHPNIIQLTAEAQAAVGRGDDPAAEAICRRLLAHNTEHEQSLAILTDILVRTDRAAEAVVLNHTVLLHFRALQLRNSIVHALHLLHEHGFRPRGILDIGAYHGEFSLLARQFFPDAAVLMVEPQQSKQALLASSARELGGDAHVRGVLLGDRARPECAFHELDTPFGSTGSSLYPELSEFPRTTVSLPMHTVDALVREFPGRCFDLVKIDVQGAELDVLRGAEATLRDVEVLFVELSLHECNRGAPRFAEVVRALDAAGFAVFDLLGMARGDDGLQRQVDGVFARKGSALWSRPTTAAVGSVRA